MVLDHEEQELDLAPIPARDAFHRVVEPLFGGVLESRRVLARRTVEGQERF